MALIIERIRDRTSKLKRVIAELKAANTTITRLTCNECTPGQAVDNWDRIFRFDMPQVCSLGRHAVLDIGYRACR